METVGVVSGGFFAGGVIHCRQSDVEALVAEEPQVVNIHVIIGGIVVDKLLQAGIRPTSQNVGLAQPLVFLIGLEDLGQPCPLAEILARPNGVRTGRRR